MPFMCQVLHRMKGREDEKKNNIISLFRNSIIILLSFGIIILFIINYTKEIIRWAQSIYPWMLCHIQIMAEISERENLQFIVNLHSRIGAGLHFSFSYFSSCISSNFIRYNWHIPLCKFKIYNVMTGYILYYEMITTVS